MKKRLFPLFLALLLLLSACGASVGNSASAAAGDSGSMPGDMNGWTRKRRQIPLRAVRTFLR